MLSPSGVSMRFGHVSMRFWASLKRARRPTDSVYHGRRMLPLKLRILKRVDRYLGRWLCLHQPPRAADLRAAHGDGRPAWQPRPVPPDDIRQILLIRPGGIGDAVLTFPMLAALRTHFPAAAMDVLGERRNTGVYRINSLVRDVHRYDQSPHLVWSTLRRLAAKRYDIVIDSEQFHYLSSVVANHLAPRYLCGFDTLGRGRFQTHRVPYNEKGYEVYSFLGLAGALLGRTLPFEPDRPFLDVDARWLQWADETLAPYRDRPLAVIVPSASSEHRFWEPQRYADVARWLTDHGFVVAILGGSDALHASRIISQGHPSSECLNLITKTSLGQTAGLVQRARLYVSADTGVLHIAYGVGTPTVHMFGSGIQDKWAPLGRKYVVINKGLPCSPCTRYGYTPPCGVACMDAITASDVIAGIEEVLKR